ncbi:pilus assembly protein [Mesorhizobium sp. CGMCC 1.15528]|uniref:Pilus assembly protein n=1 Tax=Mesorhizobium zhangyense TaxID=1776730 RepID=A0A7C9V9Z5_9HYPH|nr:TadE/TadG family type IV pilus assembly protein [Mesorhizobium zhangyense]NGN40547.1 pilus assembly protein [Mesorhizobium zhangyense]
MVIDVDDDKDTLPVPALIKWSLLRDRKGTSAVEFALLAPVFIMLFLGMAAYAIYFGASHSVQQLAADAARTAIAGLSATERSTLATNFIRLNAAGYPFVDPKKVTVNTRDSAADGSQFIVAVQYDASTLPIWKLFKGLPLPGMTISRQSTIRVGGI